MATMEKQRLTDPRITRDHLNRDVVVYVRQSSERQVLENTGSTEYQRSLAEIARSFGWTDRQIIVIEDLGLSGTGTAHRPGWKKMEELIVSGSVKVIITANTSRLSRNLSDLIQLFSLTARFNVLMIIDGR